MTESEVRQPRKAIRRTDTPRAITQRLDRIVRALELIALEYEMRGSLLNENERHDLRAMAQRLRAAILADQAKQ